jgi:filamentous hemagglutinin family protein
VLLWLTAAGLALAAPQGEQVVSGDAAFERNGPDTVIRAADDTIIEYQSFDIAGDESVRFIQPDELSRVLNRIGGANPTEIYGSLTANGIVYLVNPGGIYFRDGCLVDVGGIYAAAAQMSNADFLNDVNRFTDASGEVVNYGTIQGDAVHLVGARAANYGDIAASNGIVTLAAGEDILIGRVDGRVFARVEGAAAAAQGEAAVENAGDVDASGGQALLAAGDMYALAIRNSGHISGEEVTVEGQGEGAVEVTGEVDAPGGNVRVLGDEVRLEDADVDASGAAGGEVTIGGGVGSERTSLVEIDGVSVVRADALGAGDGGLIVVRSDSVSIQGTLSASPGGADAANGLIVIDPAQVEIVDGAAGDDVDPATIEGAMDGGADFIVEAEDKITVTDDVTTTVDNGTTLSLNDENDPNDGLTIDLNALINLQPSQALTGEATTVNVLSNAASIQNGIDVADGGATVNVVAAASADTYAEAININKPLLLIGKQSDGATDAWTGGTAGYSAGPTIVYDGATAHMVCVNPGAAGDVTIRGFKLEADNAASMGVLLESSMNEATVEYNTFDYNDGDTVLQSNPGITLSGDTNLNYNVFNDLGADNSANALSIAGQNGGCRFTGDLNIQNNTFNTKRFAVIVEAANSVGNSTGNVTVRSNTFNDSQGDSGHGILFTDNDAVGAGGLTGTVEVADNTFNNSGYGIFFFDANNLPDHLPPTVDISTSGANTFGANTVYGASWIGPLAGANYLYPGTAQSAINAAAPNDTVYLGAGDYHEDLQLDVADSPSTAGERRH